MKIRRLGWSAVPAIARSTAITFSTSPMASAEVAAKERVAYRNLNKSLISRCYAWPNRGNPPKPPRECETRRSQPGGFLRGRAILPRITPSLSNPFRSVTRGRASGRSGSLQTSYSDRLLPVLTLAIKNKTLAHNNKIPACISAISPVASSRPDCRPFQLRHQRFMAARANRKWTPESSTMYARLTWRT